MKSIIVNNYWLQMKQLLRNYLPIPVINFYKNYKYNYLNLYRAYKYNISTVVERQPLGIARNLLTTTQKLVTGRKRILFYPDFPYLKATPYQICLLLGYDVTNNPELSFDLAIKWQRYATFFPDEPILSRLAADNISIVNNNCKDVSKSYINRVFDHVFGYSIAVNPLTYNGQCVVKSDLNAQHDGKIISCPISTIKSGVVYQKLVENEVEENRVLDFRVPVFKQSIPFVYIYLKENSREEQRFHGYPSLVSVRIAEAREVFEEDEIGKILLFCQKLGLDYGELDVLRDRNERRIYIVDANNTPSSRLLFEPVEMPYNKCRLSPDDRLLALQKLAQSFQKELLDKAQK